METRVDYDRRQYAVYSAGRAPLPAMVELWSELLGRYVERDAEVLDLGSGIGTWSELLAEGLGATVAGVEPSARMREVAKREHSHPRVRYVEGAAERIPLPDLSRDAALLSYVIHHVEDRTACVTELRRVVRPGGNVVVRSTLRESLGDVPWFGFFPPARAVAERRMPALTEVVRLFADGGFEEVANEVILQETARDLSELYERLSHRAISTLELIGDDEFEAGIERMRRAAEAETEPRPVVEPVNLLVFRRR